MTARLAAASAAALVVLDQSVRDADPLGKRSLREPSLLSKGRKGHDNEPSFVVTPAECLWHCFGSGAAATVVQWVMVQLVIVGRSAT